jgi:uncharacterized phage protein (predicted DNA packaging)
MELDELKLYLKADGTEDDTLIISLQTAAEKYLTNAGIAKDYTNELYKLAVQMLVADWHENRKTSSEKAVYTLPFGLGTVITQLCCS